MERSKALCCTKQKVSEECLTLALLLCSHSLGRVKGAGARWSLATHTCGTGTGMGAGVGLSFGAFVAFGRVFDFG